MTANSASGRPQSDRAPAAACSCPSIVRLPSGVSTIGNGIRPASTPRSTTARARQAPLARSSASVAARRRAVSAAAANSSTMRG